MLKNNEHIRALVIGYGSIGNRHARLLKTMGAEVTVVSRRKIELPRIFPDLTSAFIKQRFDYVVIANETSRHLNALEKLIELGHEGKILVEKPLFSENPSKKLFTTTREEEQVFVGYHLRFDPVLLALKKALKGESIVSAEVRCASYLPEWRLGRDYRKTESALLVAGGGALRDLSHELDYVTWLLGKWTRTASIGGHFSSLEIETDDSFLILAETEHCRAVSISLNYVDRVEERWIIVNTDTATFRADFVTGVLTRSGNVIVPGPPPPVDNVYIAQHKAVLYGEVGEVCSYREGHEIVEFIQAIERSSKEGKWVRR